MTDYLLRLLKDFESSARLDIDLILKTDGRVKLLIRDAEIDRQQTQTFASVLDAVKWGKEVA